MEIIPEHSSKNKLITKLKSLSPKQIAILSVIVILVVAIPTTFFLTGQIQDLRQRAASPSSPPQPDTSPWGSMISFQDSFVKSAAPIKLRGDQSGALTVEGYVYKTQTSDVNLPSESVIFSYMPLQTGTQCQAGFVLKAVNVTTGGVTTAYKYKLDVTGNYQAVDSVTTTSSFPLNTWTYTTVTVNNNVAKLYVNGQIRNSMNLTSPFCFQETAPLVLGMQLTPTGQASQNTFFGYMDEVRVSNKLQYISNFTPPTLPWNYDRANPTPNVQALWTFNGNLQDSTVNYNYLASGLGTPTFPPSTVATSQTPTPQQAVFGQALSFDGQTFITTPLVNIPNPNDNFTIESWIKPGNISMTDEINRTTSQALFSKQPTIGIWQWYRPTSTTSLRHGYTVSFGSSDCTSSWTVGSLNDDRIPVVTPQEFSSWKHVAFVKNGRDVTIYENGNPIISETIPQTVIFCQNNYNPLLIGATTQGSQTAYGYIGQMDEVRISNKAMYTAGFTPLSTPFNYNKQAPTPNVQALYHLNGNLLDETVNYNHGQPNGDIQFVLSTNNPNPPITPVPNTPTPAMPTLTPTPMASIPPVPSNLQSVYTYSRNARIKWQQASIDNVQTYRIRWTDTSGSVITLYYFRAPGLNFGPYEYDASPLTPNTTYQFQVQSCAGAGSSCSDWSLPLSVKTTL